VARASWLDYPFRVVSRASVRWAIGCCTLVVICACQGEDEDDELYDSNGVGASAPGTGGAAGAAAADAALGGTVHLGDGEVMLYAPVGSTNFNLRARFQETNPPNPPCAVVVEGNCWVTACSADPASVARPHADTITYSSAEVGFSATISPDVNGNYATLDAPFSGGRFTGQEAVTVSATGGAPAPPQVPGFQLTMAYPLLLLLDSPATTDGAVVASRATGFTLNFSRGVAGVFVDFLTVSSGSGTTNVLNCRAPSSQGSITVSANLLQYLGPGAMLKPLSSTSQTIEAGGYSVTVSVAGEMLTADRSSVIQIQLQ
jgi:hypothetical protein